MRIAMNDLLNAWAAGGMTFALGLLAWTMYKRGYPWLAVGASIWTLGFANRLGVILIDSYGTRPDWMTSILRDYAWTYRSIGAATLLGGLWVMAHRETPHDVYDALLVRANGTLNGDH